VQTSEVLNFTARNAALGLNLPDVPITIDSPQEPIGCVVLFHGFGRKPDALDELTTALIDAGMWVVRPYLKSRAKGGLNDRDLMRAVGDEVQGLKPVDLPVVVMGHSAGGAVAMVVAKEMIERAQPVVGVLLIDANGSIENIMQPGFDALSERGIPVRTVAASAGRCNGKAATARWLMEQSQPFAGIQLTTGRHCDVEGTKSDLTCRLLCGGVPDPTNAAIIRTLAVGWSRAWLTRKSEPEIEPGGKRLSIWEDLRVVKVL